MYWTASLILPYTSAMESHIAQLNIGRARFDLADQRMAEFVDSLDRVNAVAERSPGFVWRLVGEGNDATDVEVPGAPDMIANLSVWESVEALENFVFRTIHKYFYQHQETWFEPLSGRHFVMWCVNVGHRPDMTEAVQMLERYRMEGASATIFGWKEAPGGRQAKQFASLRGRCA